MLNDIEDFNFDHSSSSSSSSSSDSDSDDNKPDFDYYHTTDVISFLNKLNIILVSKFMKKLNIWLKLVPYPELI